jgi:hypothetical protein
LPSIEPEQGHETEQGNSATARIAVGSLRDSGPTFSDAFRLSDGQGLPHPQTCIGQPAGEWNDDDYDVLANGEGRPHLQGGCLASRNSLEWTLAFGHHEDRTPTHGYAASREDATAAFAKTWRRE